MSLAGKILAVLNVLAALACAFLASQSYAKRTAWSYACLRHDLAVDGLPLDDRQKDAEGRIVRELINDGTLSEMFSGAGTPVATQDDEVKAVRQQLNGRAEAAGDKKAQVLARMLHPLARASARRAELEQLIQGKLPTDEAARKKLTDDLQAEFDKAFDDVAGLEKSMPADKKDTLPLGHKRDRVASLLYSLATVMDEDAANTLPRDALDSGYFRRYLVVVGLQAAGREAHAQGEAQQAMLREVRSTIEQERMHFLAAHKTAVHEVLKLASLLDDRRKYLAEQQATVQKNQDVINLRKEYVRTLQEQYDKAKESTRAALARQAKREAAVHASHLALREAYDRIVQLEVELRRLEKLVLVSATTGVEGGAR